MTQYPFMAHCHVRFVSSLTKTLSLHGVFFQHSMSSFSSQQNVSPHYFTVTTIFASSGDRNYKGYTVYNPQASTVENYYVHTGFSMPGRDFTVCLWWRLLTLDSSTYTCLTSISVEGKLQALYTYNYYD